MNNLLTITIPTYNRFRYLTKCLNQLLPQVERYSDVVKLLITDNCSTDETQAYLQELAKQYSFIMYHRNDTNIGYSGNQINCIQMPESIYTAILCDDDVYLDNALDTIIPVLQQREWAFVALNYYGFKKDFRVPSNTNFAPIKDKVFNRATDIMNYPSVGHFSGLIYNTVQSKKALNSILDKYNYEFYEEQRGVLYDIAYRQLRHSPLPSFFIGERVLANFEQNTFDYDSLTHLCIEYYKFILNLYNEDVIDNVDLICKKEQVLRQLPRFSFSSLSTKTINQINFYWNELERLELLTPKNRILLFLIFNSAKIRPLQILMRGVYMIYKFFK